MDSWLSDQELARYDLVLEELIEYVANGRLEILSMSTFT